MSLKNLTVQNIRNLMPSRQVYTTEQVERYIERTIEPELRACAALNCSHTTVGVDRGMLLPCERILTKLGFKVGIDQEQSILIIRWKS